MLKGAEGSVALRRYLDVTREQNLAIALALTQTYHTDHIPMFPPRGSVEGHVGTGANCDR